MEINSDNEQDIEEATIESLGMRLRSAREGKGLTLDVVAHQLHLSQQRLIDMENDEYRFAGAETYAKGYLRSYAKLLGLDPDKIVHDFNRLNYTNSIERHETKFIAKRQLSSGDRSMRWITYSIGIVLVFLVAIWWRSQPSHAVKTAVISETPQETTIEITPQSSAKAQAVEVQPVEASEESAKPIELDSAADENANHLNFGSEAADSLDTSPKIDSAQPAMTGQTPTRPNLEEPSDSEEDITLRGAHKKHSWNEWRTQRSKILVGQRDQSEVGMSQALEKVFSRG